MLRPVDEEQLRLRLDAIDAQLARIMQFVDRLSPLLDRIRQNPMTKKMLGL